MGRSQRPNLGATSARAETRRAKRSAEPPPALAAAASRPSNGDRGSGRRGTEPRAVTAAAERVVSAVGVAAPSSVVTSSVADAGDECVGFERADDASRLVGLEAGGGGVVAAGVLAVRPVSGAGPSGFAVGGALVPVTTVLAPASAVLAVDVTVGTTFAVAVASVAVAVFTAAGSASVVPLTTACAVCTVCAAPLTTDWAVPLTTACAVCTVWAAVPLTTDLAVCVTSVEVCVTAAVDDETVSLTAAAVRDTVAVAVVVAAVVAAVAVAAVVVAAVAAVATVVSAAFAAVVVAD